MTLKVEAPETPSGSQHQLFRDATVSFAVDISGSTYGQTLIAEKAFIRMMANLLSQTSRYRAKVLPWDHTAHPVHSIAQVDRLEDCGGTNPGVILNSPSHMAALRESSLWFIMTDGLIPPRERAKFANDVALHGVHGISCVIVIFGDPSTGPASCDISVGVGVFAVVPNCAFLFCNETNGDLRALQTKGTFNVLLKGELHPVFDSATRWDALPQVSVADFADVRLPKAQILGANEMALEDSLVINMQDLFANRLSQDQIDRIFDNPMNLESVRLTMQARNQPDQFRDWVQQQAINLDDPLYKPRPDLSNTAASLFAGIMDSVRQGQLPPKNLQSLLRRAYRRNMQSFIVRRQQQIDGAERRKVLIETSSSSSFSRIDHGGSISTPSTRTKVFRSRNQTRSSSKKTETPYHRERPGAQATAQPRQNTQEAEEPWGSWESSVTDHSLRGLLYTPGFRSSQGSFKGTCPLCGTKEITLAWLFRAPSSKNLSVPINGPPGSGIGVGGTAGFPLPGSSTRLTFPLDMGHFPETAGVLARWPFPAQPQVPMVACDPCSYFCANAGPSSSGALGITAALPLVNFGENKESMLRILGMAFGSRFEEGDLAQVFLSVLILAEQELSRNGADTPLSSHQKSLKDGDDDFSKSGLDVPEVMDAAAQLNVFREAVEWTARDLLQGVEVVWTLSETLSGEHSGVAGALGEVLGGLLERLDGTGNEHGGREAGPLLRYPLPGFVVIIKLAGLIGLTQERRDRAVARRLMFLMCEDLERRAEHVPGAKSGVQSLGELVGWEQPVRIKGDGGLLDTVKEWERRAGEGSWIGAALAMFLHGLWRVRTISPAASATARGSFAAVMGFEEVMDAFASPEKVDEAMVRDAVGRWVGDSGSHTMLTS
ncbi:hypothetical protein QBC42DRAFT_339105 [Cladorrhinum samala]|uniref:Uncharacterized protein n=1 Tax=Cladorrhinum samala TaxID=585594 RepID=A0AAV9HMN3_9PEZI|nr:hypothetical protein QBC42DRAFT_339105 [Cladorrhinum samala]